MRKFVWENKVSNRGEGFWGDCNEILETFLNNLLPSARSFCDIGLFYAFKLCSRNQSHFGYISNNMPYLHYSYSLMQALHKSKESQCMDCTRELGEDSAEVPGITTRHNLIETEKLLLFLSDLTNIAPIAIKKIPQQFPYVVEIAETKYILHGKVYST
ncbi:hypothetical protein RMATCC62417_01646 [Rhizopus microsporus]|nr:hypothetical protein RMATCC62417_01646 [Rhizopus microsporus]